VDEVRTTLARLWDRPAPDGSRNLRENAARLAALLEDWTRRRVLKLADEAFVEYVTLTGRFAVSAEKPAAARKPSALGKLLLRGFLLAAVAARLQSRGEGRGLRLGLRVRLLRVALHLHGLGPKTEGVDRGAARRVRVTLEEPAVHGMAYHLIRSTLATLPSGRRPLVDEVTFAFATLDTALALGAMRAAADGREVLTGEDFTAGLVEAADLAQTSADGPLAGFLESFTGGLEALRVFVQGGGS
jgi:hypothetical protein